MRITWDRGSIAKVNVSPSKQGRLYVTVVDLEGGEKFEFSSDTLVYAEILGTVGQVGRIEGKFESYAFADQNTGAARLGWKGTEVTFKLAK